MILTIWFARILTMVLRTTGKGSGTALPGLLAQRHVHGALSYYAPQIRKLILISGTNGKTTTQSILAEIFQAAGMKVVANSAGSNMKHGIISTLLSESGLLGRLHADVVILEVEEATLPQIVAELTPSLVIITNLYRDQLDAYGEIDRTQKFIRQALEMAPDAQVLLNADDPKVAFLTQGLPNKTLYYGIDENEHRHFKYEGEHRQGEVDFKGENVSIMPDLSSRFEHKGVSYSLKTPGVFHVYNGLAAIATAQILGVEQDAIARGVEKSTAAFGRGEDIVKNGLTYKLLLVKNPAGASLTLELLKNVANPVLVFALNDRIADGRDVSWIWDADFELLNEIKPSLVICTGSRRHDMLLRVKYALGSLDNCLLADSLTEVEDQLSSHGLPAQAGLTGGSMVYVLPTYTAMLEFRKHLTGSALE